jgi:ABC-type uncharacterized transport system involved in gliding motility auxiliary subunit
VNRAAILVGVQAITVAAILACLGVVAARHPWRLDLTPEKRFTLSPRTREVLARLATEVTITVFYSSQDTARRREMGELLALYAEATRRLTVRFLDLDRSPGAADRLGVSAYNVAIAEAGERRQRITPVTEETITAALLAAAGRPPLVAYFAVGHGELDLRDDEPRRGGSEAGRALHAGGFDVRPLEGVASVPADAELLLIAGPARELSTAELAGLTTYLERGGRLLVFCDQNTPRGLDAFLRRLGVELGADVVVDDRGRLLGTDGLSARVAYLNQTLVPTVPDAQALLPLAQTIRLLDVAGIRADYLAMTGETTWADVDRRGPSGGAVEFRSGRDRRGPLPVAAMARLVGAGGGEGRLVIVGDADFATNLHLGVLGNRDFLLTVADLTARDDVLPAADTAPRPAGTFSPLALTDRQAALVFWGGVVAPALLFALAALGARRRQRRA